MNLLVGEKGVVTLVLEAALNAEGAPVFRGMVREALARSPKELVLDCTSLNYIDSTGLGLLTLAKSEASRIGCVVKLYNVSNGHTRKVLELVRFDQMFPIIYAKAEAAQ